MTPTTSPFSTVRETNLFVPVLTAAVVPAYNEAGRIGAVLEAIARAQHVQEIIVVTDGCADNTAEEARAVAERLASEFAANVARGVGCRELRVFELKHNIGKGGAMTYGALRTEAEVLLFLDADLIGLETQQVDDLLAPMIVEEPAQRADMTLGLFGAVRGGIFGWWLGVCHRQMAALTGQRAIRREVFLAVPGLTNSRFGIETAITRYVKYVWKLKVSNVPLHGVTHPVKEEKIGVLKGFRHRLNMYGEIAAWLMLDIIRNQASAQRREQAMQMRERFSNRF
jgi:glycosyltransferase involved in cell wall biosynthesis